MTTMNKKTVKEHEDRFINVPKPALLPLLGLLLSLLACWGWTNVMIAAWEPLGVGQAFCDETKCDVSLKALAIVPGFITTHALILGAIISAAAFLKGGYSRLKRLDEGGLIWGLIGGLIVGLIVDLIVGLIGGLIGGLIVGLIVGLIWGLIGGLIVGLIVGLTNECDD